VLTLAAMVVFRRRSGGDCHADRAANYVDAVTERPAIGTVVLAGGSRTLGQALANDLADRGLGVVVLARRPDPGARHRQVGWDGRFPGPWTSELGDPRPTAVVNLAGRRVDARPTPANIADLRSSRVGPTRALVAASRAAQQPLARWVQASTTAIWADAGEKRVTEATPVPTGAAALPQMTGVAVPWEEAAGAYTEHLVVLRTSIVLMPHSPALDRLLLLTRLGVGGRVGSGHQCLAGSTSTTGWRWPPATSGGRVWRCRHGPSGPQRYQGADGDERLPGFREPMARSRGN